MRRASCLCVVALTALLAAGCGDPNQFDPAANKPEAPGGHPLLPGGGVIGPGGDFVAGAGPQSDCLDGWATPARSNPVRDDVLEAIDKAAGLASDPSLDQLRVFTGPEALGRDADAHPWTFAYARVTTPPGARGRWLLRGEDASALVAVARSAYDGRGWVPAQWSALGSGADPASLLVPMLTGCLTGTGG